MQTDLSRRRRFRRRFAFGGVGLAAVVALLVAMAIPAAADTIQFTGQGTDNGACGSFEGQPPGPGGTQTWQFNLTGTEAGATMSASFSDNTTVTDKPEDTHNGNTSMWFIVTDAGATVISASATFTPAPNGNPQFVVSHCTAGGEKPPTPPTPETPTTTPTAPGAGAAVAVVSAARFTG